MTEKTRDEKREDARKQVARWLSDSDTWVGLFENYDLDSSECGERCAFPFSLSDGSFEGSIVGKTRAPDGKTIGPGWRYILAGKTKSVEEVIDFLD